MKFRWETEFKETEIGEIPKDWEIKKLGDLLRSLESGNRPKGGILAHSPNGILSIGGENINWDGSLDLTKCLRFDENFYKNLRKGIIEQGDILLVKDGATIGKLAYIKEVPEGKAMVNEHVFLLKTNNFKTNSRFLYYFLFSEIGQQQIESSISGSAQGGINKSIQDNILVFYPPLPEQSRIATVLSWFDDLIEIKKRQNEILEKTAMAIFKSWFVDFEPFKDEEFVNNEELGKEMPKGCEIKRLGEVIKIESGGSAPQKEEYFIGGKNPFVRVKHLTNHPCVEEADFITDEAVKQHNLKLYNEGSIIFQRSGESLSFGRVNILPFDAYIVNHLAVIPNLPSNKLLMEFLFFTLKNILIELIEERSGTALPYIRVSDIEKKEIPIPPSHILQSFHPLIEPLFQKIILNQKQIMTLRKIRDTLLPLLVFGKLRVEEL